MESIGLRRLPLVRTIRSYLLLNLPELVDHLFMNITHFDSKGGLRFQVSLIAM